MAVAAAAGDGRGIHLNDTSAQPSNPTRRWPRFSLLTLIVFVNVVGVLLWANYHRTTRSRKPSQYVSDIVFVDGMPEHTGFERSGPRTAPILVCEERGWPFGFDSLVLQAEYPDGTKYSIPPERVRRLRFEIIPATYTAITLNSIVAILITALAAFTTEQLVRKSRKPYPVLMTTEPESYEDVVKLTRPYSGSAGILVTTGWGFFLLSLFLPTVDDIIGLEIAIIGAIRLVHPSEWYNQWQIWYVAVILGNFANLLMLVSPYLMTHKNRLGLWISSTLMILPAVFIPAIAMLLNSKFEGFRIGYYVWWLSFGLVAGGLVTRAGTAEYLVSKIRKAKHHDG